MATRGARVGSVVRRSVLAALAAGIVVLVAAGCGAGNDDPSRTDARDLRDLERTGVDMLSEAQIERFARVRIPPSATNLRSLSRSAMDTQLLVSFRLPREALAEFVASGNFRGELTEGDRAIGSTVGEQLGWRLGGAKRIEGLADVGDGLGRNLVVVLDDPQRPAVHLEVATL